MGKIKNALVANKEKILMFGGCLGVLATAVLTWRAARKSYKMVEETPKEEFERTWKNYIPPTAGCTLTIAMILLSGKISADKYAALLASYFSVMKAYDEYRSQVQEKYGYEEEQIILNNTLSRIDGCNPPATTNNSEKVIFIDDITGTEWLDTVEHIKDVRYLFNETWAKSYCYASIATLFDLYGVPISGEWLEYSDHVPEHYGWDASDAIEYEYVWIDIDLIPEEDEQRGVMYYRIVYNIEPKDI